MGFEMEDERGSSNDSPQEEGRKEQDEEGESLLWSCLPHELLVRILAFLPVYKQLELLTVCKSWRSLYQSPRMSSEFAPRETWLVVRRNSYTVHGMELLAFCPTLNRWCHLPRSFWENYSMASAGGLIVYRSQDLASLNYLVVFNLLTKATKTLCDPSSPDNYMPRAFELTMLANPVAGFYQVIAISIEDRTTELLKGHFMKVYDSRTQSWEWKVRNSGSSNGQALVYVSGSQSWEWKDRHHRGSTGNVLDDDLFVLDKRNGAVYTYNAERCVWSTVKTPAPSCTAKGGSPLNLVLETIVKCKGRLLLVGLLESENDGSWTIEGLGVWEWKSVGQGIGRWAESATTPPEYWEAYRSLGPARARGRFHCSVANDNLICMIGLTGNYCPHLSYDLDRGSWQRLPFYGDDPDYLGFFTYEPSWNAVP